MKRMETVLQVISDAPSVIYADFTPLADYFQLSSPHREAFEPQSMTKTLHYQPRL